MRSKYVKEITGWTIKLDTSYFNVLDSSIRSNQEIKPESIGYLLGMAKPILKDFRCVVCQNKIFTRELEKGTEDSLVWELNGKSHIKCYEERLKAAKKNQSNYE